MNAPRLIAFSEPGLSAVLPAARRIATLLGGPLHVLSAGEAPAAPQDDALATSGTDVIFESFSGTRDQRFQELVEQQPLSMLALPLPPPEGRIEGLFAAVDAPLLLLPPDLPDRWKLRRLLLPHDGQQLSSRRIEQVFALAREVDAAFYVLHVVPPEDGALPELPTYLDQPHLEWPEWTRGFLSRLNLLPEDAQSLRPRFFIAHGAPGAEILRFAEANDVDLIAISWHGSLQQARADILKELVANARRPLLLIRDPLECRREAPLAAWTAESARLE